MLAIHLSSTLKYQIHRSHKLCNSVDSSTNFCQQNAFLEFENESKSLYTLLFLVFLGLMSRFKLKHRFHPKYDEKRKKKAFKVFATLKGMLSASPFFSYSLTLDLFHYSIYLQLWIHVSLIFVCSYSCKVFNLNILW